MLMVGLLQSRTKQEKEDQVVRRRREAGFTLVEVLAVVVILVILAGVGFVVVNQQIEKSRKSTDVANVRTIADAVNRYIMDKNGTVPGTVDDLVREGYLAKKPTDPWTNKDYTISNDPQNRKVTIKSPYDPDPNATGEGKDSYEVVLQY